MAEIGLHTLKPVRGSRQRKHRAGRGNGSGMGKTAGRGHKGAGARSGSKRKIALEGGQMPLHMRLRKLKGPHMKKSMPFEPFRTRTQAVNLSDLEARYSEGDSVTPQTLRERGLATRAGVPVKVLARGSLSKSLEVQAHAFSARAREQIQVAGGSVTVIDA